MRLTKDLTRSMRSLMTQKTRGYSDTAKVIRVDGDTAWVHIPGGVEETPVKMSINANPGDRVKIRVEGGKAWIAGNDSAPPTDDTTAKRLVEQVTIDNTAHIPETRKRETTVEINADGFVSRSIEMQDIEGKRLVGCIGVMVYGNYKQYCQIAGFRAEGKNIRLILRNTSDARQSWHVTVVGLYI